MPTGVSISHLADRGIQENPGNKGEAGWIEEQENGGDGPSPLRPGPQRAGLLQQSFRLEPELGALLEMAIASWCDP